MSESKGEKASESSASAHKASDKQEHKRHRRDTGDEDFLYIPDLHKPEKLVRVDPNRNHRIRKYLDMTKPELQKWLRHNGQLVTGRKYDLLLRCVDGELNGRIPGCPQCHRGQMFYDYTQAKFVCNGYFDEVAQNPIHCGHTQDNVTREPWHDIEKDPAVSKGGKKEKGEDEPGHHRDHPDHHHHDHHCKVEANHPLVDLLEDMAYYHSVKKDPDWGFRARAFISAARAIEHLDFEVDGKKVTALSLGDKSSSHHVEKIGKSSADVMQAFLDSGKSRSPHLDELRSSIKDTHDGSEKSKDELHKKKEAAASSHKKNSD